LKVTNQLNQVRQQIDSWEGQLKYLNSQIDLSTITVNLTAEKEVQIFGLNWRPITVIKQAFRSLLGGLMSYANLIIAAIIFLPVIILWLITILLIAWIVWWVVKQVKKLTKTKKKTKKSAS
jgi:large-conductance mechanosensitive channel